MKEVIYRKFCPDCDKPLDVPIWRRCPACSKDKYRRYAREKYKITPRDKEKQRLYQIEYRKRNAEKFKAYKKKYRELYVIKSTP